MLIILLLSPFDEESLNIPFSGNFIFGGCHIRYPREENPVKNGQKTQIASKLMSSPENSIGS